MKPIINPWIFYLADTAETFKTISILLAVGGAITFVILFALFNEDYCYNDDEKNKNKITLKKLIIFTIICTLFSIFIPWRDTVYKMTIANYVTENNISNTKEEAKDIIDYIADKFNKEK